MQPQLAANVLADEVFEHTSFATGYRPADRRPRPWLSTPCTCSVRRSRWQLSWPFAFIHYDRREEHQRGCPWSWRSRARWTLGVRFLLPGLLARSLYATFSATYGAGGCTLTPNLTCVRIVDRKASPAFRAIDNARDELSETLAFPKVDDKDIEFSTCRQERTLSMQQRLSTARAILENVRNELQSSFCAGKASPCDQDPTGLTLLHVGQPKPVYGLF